MIVRLPCHPTPLGYLFVLPTYIAVLLCLWLVRAVVVAVGLLLWLAWRAVTPAGLALLTAAPILRSAERRPTASSGSRL